MDGTALDPVLGPIRRRDRLWVPLSGLIVVGAIFYGSAALLIALWLGFTAVSPPLAAFERTVLRQLVLDGVLFNALLSIGAVAWLRYREPRAPSWRTLLNVGRPSLREGVLVVVGLAALIATVLGFQWLYDAVGVTYAGSESSAGLSRWPWLYLVKVPIAVVFVGTAEELLIRRGLQDWLRTAFGPAAAVVLASVLFALLHLGGSYTGPGALASLGVVFALSLLLGAIYSYADDLLVVVAVHGLFDATVALLNFL